MKFIINILHLSNEVLFFQFNLCSKNQSEYNVF